MEPGWPFGGRPTPERVWSLWKTGWLMEAEINAHPLGYELRVYLRGDYLYSLVHPTREQAEAGANERKRELLAEGWADRRECRSELTMPPEPPPGVVLPACIVEATESSSDLARRGLWGV